MNKCIIINCKNKANNIYFIRINGKKVFCCNKHYEKLIKGEKKPKKGFKNT